jgi:hypothetical protein
MKRFATALIALRNVPVSEIEDPKERERLEKVGRTTSLTTSATHHLVITACSVEEANRVAITQSGKFPVKEGWYNHKACSIEIP